MGNVSNLYYRMHFSTVLFVNILQYDPVIYIGIFRYGLQLVHKSLECRVNFFLSKEIWDILTAML